MRKFICQAQSNSFVKTQEAFVRRFADARNHIFATGVNARRQVQQPQTDAREIAKNADKH
jgi:hypothetical protein